MMRRAVLVLLLPTAVASTLGAQAAPAATATPTAVAAAAKVHCNVHREEPSDAEAALSREDYDAALDLFAQMSATSPDVSRLGIIRTQLEQDKVTEAREAATAWASEKPKDASAVEAVAEVLLRAGEPHEAYVKALDALQLDPCSARARLTLAAIDQLAGLYATGRNYLDVAHKLEPNDPEIRFAWTATLPRAERIKAYAAEMNDERLRSKKRREQLAESVAHAADYSPKDCTVREAVTSAKIPIRSIMDGPNRFSAYALDVAFNGKQRRLEIDTGASGILLTRGAAAGLGLVHEQKLITGGVGDKGDVPSAIAHVASVKIGNLEFQNCAVEILEKRSQLDVDGLIGGNVFNKFLLTIDYPNKVIALDQLPPRPDEKKASETLKTAESPAAAGAAVDDTDDHTAHDRYIAPAMKDWTKIYRAGHEILLPVSIGGSRELLFLVDTGAGLMSISPAAAKEVTKVHRDDFSRVVGISGEVAKVYETGGFDFVFANLRQKVESMSAFDTTKISHNTGVEVSGFLGSPVLYRLTLHIDYRDNLIKLDYDPKNDQRLR